MKLWPQLPLGGFMSAYGELTPQFLIVTRPQRPDVGKQVIPLKNLIEVQFGDGGIVSVSENRPASER